MNLKNIGIHAENQSKPEICSTHGEYLSRNIFNNVWTKCPQCAAERHAAEQRESEEKAAMERHRSLKLRLGIAGIPDRFQNRTLENFETKNDGQLRVLNFANHYSNSFTDVLSTGQSAIFCGPPGTGKTHLAVGIGMRALSFNKTVLFITVQRMVRRYKETWRKGSAESESDVINLLASPDLLILDEVGVQFGSEFEKHVLFDVLNERYEKRRPNILISNSLPDEVRQFLGESAYDRLREDNGKFVPFNWESYRGN